ncbi:unnamed protein product [Fraxinus pennsylvanica]|uniref:Flotillin-like n=1 Tax=Fraxinus pennsylvanica TaxID=56036 RepID=A0AAD2DM53_9LAMI|nr:unnamed protein product [Fraxinus pennsylvanica]
MKTKVLEANWDLYKKPFRDYRLPDDQWWNVSRNGQYQCGGVPGLQPNISIWTNGDGEAKDGTGGVNCAMKEIAGVYRMLPPLFTTVIEQTGMLPPAWMGTLTDFDHSTNG